MKKLFIILALTVISCSTDKPTDATSQNNCYQIIAKGIDNRGDYIIIKYTTNTQRRYKVDNYLNYLQQSTICEPINLTQQPL